MAIRDGWTAREIRARCESMRTVLEDRALATPAELAAYWPGGDENSNDARSYGGWIYCYGNYLRFLGREERQESDAETSLARQAAEDALRGAPVYVTLEATDAEGRPRVVGVFPKSFHALAHCAERDAILGRMATYVQQLAVSADPRAAGLIGPVLHEAAYQQRLLCWVVTEERPGCPFPDHDPRPDPPAWTADLSPLDVFQLVQAHQTVNGARLQLVTHLLSPPEPLTGRRPASWQTLVAAAAKTLGRDARSLMRDTTLESLVAQVAITADAEREAHEAARTAGGR